MQMTDRDPLWKAARQRAARDGVVNYSTTLKHYKQMRLRDLRKGLEGAVEGVRASIMDRLETLQKSDASGLDSALKELEDTVDGE